MDQPEKKTIAVSFKEIMYHVVAEPGEYTMKFKVYEIFGSTGETIFFRHPEDFGIEKIEEAEVFMSGFVKWDGCMHYRFDAQDECMLHICGRSDAEDIGKLMSALYDLASRNIEHADPGLME